MSNALSIAAVTATLRSLLDQGLNADVAGTTVTTRPPDRARNGTTGNQVNLFLYHTAVNPAWRNRDVPWRVKPGESGHTPLPLNLYYLITVYSGENEDDIDTTTDPNRLLGNHRLLGQAMSILHDHPLLNMAEINAILPPDDETDYPYDQVENVRITPQTLSMEDISKIWAGFQTQYRLSAAYEVSVVLIESTRPRRSPMPVLRRGPEDRGVNSVLGPFPVLEEVRRPAGARFGVQLGDVIEVIGQNLGGDVVEVRFSHPLLDDAVRLAPGPGSTPTRLDVTLPAHDEGTAVSDWAAGFYAVDVVIEKQAGETERTTNQVPLSLSPIVQDITPNPAARDGSGNVTLTLTCAPQVLPEQQARLLLGEREIQAEPHPTAATTLDFAITDAPTGEFVVRLRLDGVDSLPILLTESGPIFDPDQKVTIT
jgi:hypothetical protein